MNNESHHDWPTLLTHRAEDHPGRVAFSFLVDGDPDRAQTLTYYELFSQARGIAANLKNIGASGQVALLLYPPGLDFISALFGCMFARVIGIPLYAPHRRKLSLIAAIGKAAGASVALTTTGAARTTAISDLTYHLPPLRWLMTDARDAVSDGRDIQGTPAVDGIAYLQYTSGSTSQPKGVVIRHAHSLAQCRSDHLAWRVGEGGPIVSWLPHFHDFGLVFGILQTVFSGLTCYQMSPAVFVQQPVRWLQAISRFGAKLSAAPDFGFAHCVQRINPFEVKGLSLHTWKVAPNGAEPVRAQTVHAFHQKFGRYGFCAQAFYPSYGLAEATLRVTSCQWRPETGVLHLDGRALGRRQVALADSAGPHVVTCVSCGTPIGDTEVAIVDPEHRTRIESGVGEIWIRGETVASGYWRDEEATSRVFGARCDDSGGPYLRTGDLGFYRDGLFVVGRLKDVIVVRGLNHYPQDIELTVEACHPALRAGYCAAVRLPSDDREAVAIVAELERGYENSPAHAEIIVAIRQAVSENHELSVDEIHLLPPGTIPRTSSGKIQRTRCRWLRETEGLPATTSWIRGRSRKEAPHANV